jgi:hypothetical protein
MVIPGGRSGEIQYLKLLLKRADGGVDEKRVLAGELRCRWSGKN